MLAPFLLLLQVLSPTAVHVTVDGVDRVAYVCSPIQTSGKPPVVFMFHGHGGSAERCMQHFEMEKRWPEALIVYCDGLPVTTAGGDGKGWELEANDKNRDIRFFDALYPKVLSNFHGDAKRVFAWGFSNGGMFIYTLWSMRADKFAGFCASGSAIVTDDIHLSTPKPAFITISGNDEIVPTPYQQQAFDQVKKTNASQTSGTPYGATGTLFKGEKPVVLWKYNGGHEFPFQSFPKLIEFFKSIG